MNDPIDRAAKAARAYMHREASREDVVDHTTSGVCAEAKEDLDEKLRRHHIMCLGLNEIKIGEYNTALVGSIWKKLAQETDPNNHPNDFVYYNKMKDMLDEATSAVQAETVRYLHLIGQQDIPPWEDQETRARVQREIEEEAAEHEDAAYFCGKHMYDFGLDPTDTMDYTIEAFDEEVELELVKELAVGRLIACTACHGTGAAKRCLKDCVCTGPMPGYVRRTLPANLYGDPPPILQEGWDRCQDCLRSPGKVATKACPACGGSSTESETVVVSVDLARIDPETNEVLLVGQGNIPSRPRFLHGDINVKIISKSGPKPPTHENPLIAMFASQRASRWWSKLKGRSEREVRFLPREKWQKALFTWVSLGLDGVELHPMAKRFVYEAREAASDVYAKHKTGEVYQALRMDPELHDWLAEELTKELPEVNFTNEETPVKGRKRGPEQGTIQALHDLQHTTNVKDFFAKRKILDKKLSTMRRNSRRK